MAVKMETWNVTSNCMATLHIRKKKTYENC